MKWLDQLNALRSDAPFVIHGPPIPTTPVLLTVPHAGRLYPQPLIDNARVDMSVLRRLEDRFADAMIDLAVAAGVTSYVARAARAWIDLNRAETAWDSSLIADAVPSAMPDSKVRAGLGIIPGRLHPEGLLWRRRWHLAELDDRIVDVYRPWHHAINEGLTSRARIFGAAVLIDLHSMPTQAGGFPAIVIGDRHGQSASMALVDRLMAVVDGMGFTVARNNPFAGAYTIERHGKRVGPIEAVQIEVDRAIYVAADGSGVAHDVSQIRRLVLNLANAAAAHVAESGSISIAAE